LITVTPGTPLSGALGDGDNLAVAGVQLTPPDMGFSANGTKEVEFVNVVGKIWTGTTPGPRSAWRTSFRQAARATS